MLPTLPLWSAPFLILAGILFRCGWDAGISHFVGPPPPGRPVDWLERWGKFAFVPLITRAFVEEVVFRYLPILFATLAGFPHANAWMFLIWTQIIFGTAHGGWKGIFFQGVSGFQYLMFFLLMGGATNPVAGLAVATTAHALRNLPVILPKDKTPPWL